MSPRTSTSGFHLPVCKRRARFQSRVASVLDEAIVPNFSSLNRPDGGGKVTDNRINYSFTRLLTPAVVAIAVHSVPWASSPICFQCKAPAALLVAETPVRPSSLVRRVGDRSQRQTARHQVRLAWQQIAASVQILAAVVNRTVVARVAIGSLTLARYFDIR
jgi:hypothetical protein